MTPGGASPPRPRVVFVHPAIRPYRGHIYRALQERFEARFYGIGFEAVNRRWAGHFGIHNLEILPQRRFLAYRSGVSWELLRRAWRDDYDVWIASTMYAFSTHAAFPIVKCRQRLFVLWTEDWYWGGDRLSRAIESSCRWMLSKVDLVIAAGSRQAEFLRAAGVPADRIALAYNSFVPPAGLITDPGLSSLVHTKERFRVLYLGRMLDYKGPDCLLRAYARLDARAPGRTELVFCGQGPAEAACRRLAAELGLRHVHFLGRVDPSETREFYRSADVFVHPCRWVPDARVKGEAWGFVVNEAMACGIPVIATSAVAAAHDLIADGVSGFVVPPGDEEAIGDRLLRLFEHPELRLAMGRAAQETIRRTFLPEVQARAFCDAIDRVWGARAAPGRRQAAQ
jgi:glycosyltransferase involved in cell wall biosynthesis